MKVLQFFFVLILAAVVIEAKTKTWVGFNFQEIVEDITIHKYKNSLRTAQVPYESDDGRKFQGYAAINAPEAGQKAPATVLILPGVNGVGEYERSVARWLARSGYNAFVVDLYGLKGTFNRSGVATLAASLMNTPAVLAARVSMGLNAFLNRPSVQGVWPLIDPSKIAAVGFGVGGVAVLETIKEGASLKAGVTLFAPVKSGSPNKKITVPVLVLAGAKDSVIPLSTVNSFLSESALLGSSVEGKIYGQAAYAWTVPDAKKNNITGAGFNEKLALKAYNDVLSFLGDAFSM